MNPRQVWITSVLLLMASSGPAKAHPGSGIAVDRQGQVYFVDTGAGVWKIDRKLRLSRHPGPAYHWMAIVPSGRGAQARMPTGTGGELPVVGADPALALSSDFPVAFGADGTFYYPQAGRDGRVRIFRSGPDGIPHEFAMLPVATEVGEDGRSRPVQWIHGLAAAPDGSLYYTERHAVRRISSKGQVTLVAGNVTVPGCVRPSAITVERVGPGLYGLAVAPDGNVYVAATACSALLKVTPKGTVSVVIRGADSWSPTGVAVHGKDLYVLEYRYIPAERREEWLPRVRKISGGKVSVIARIPSH